MSPGWRASYHTWGNRINYFQDFWFQQNNISSCKPPTNHVFPNLEELFPGYGKNDFTRAPRRRPRKRWREEVWERLRRQTLSRISLPSIILANARSLCTNTEELQDLIRHQHKYKDACILAITETWLRESDPNNDMLIDNFWAPLCKDQDIKTTDKSCRGGVCLYINERLCKTAFQRKILF